MDTNQHTKIRQAFEGIQGYKEEEQRLHEGVTIYEDINNYLMELRERDNIKVRNITA